MNHAPKLFLTKINKMLKLVGKHTKSVYTILKRRQKTRDRKIKVEHYNLFNSLVSFTKSVEKLLYKRAIRDNVPADLGGCGREQPEDSQIV